MRLIIVYDVVSNSRRRRLAKGLEAEAQRIQFSVFETEGNAAAERRIRDLIESEIDAGEDKARIFRLCKACESRTWLWGVGGFVDPPEDVIY